MRHPGRLDRGGVEYLANSGDLAVGDGVALHDAQRAESLDLKVIKNIASSWPLMADTTLAADTAEAKPSRAGRKDWALRVLVERTLHLQRFVEQRAAPG